MVKAKREPVRTCVACREEGGKRSLVRVVRTPEGTAALDLTGRAPGRGAYLHPTGECVAQARKRKSLERALKTTVPVEFWEGMPTS